MKFKLKNSLLISAVLAATGMAASNAHAGATITFGEDKYVSVGFGFISNYISAEDAAPNGNDRSNDFNLFSARMYMSGSFNKYIKGMLNTERSGGGEGNIEVIDANVQFQLTPEIAIWAGRFLSPSDRANMTGPYYSSGGGGVGYWANISSRYGWNGGVIGRDEGVAFVGSFLEDKLAVSFGAFEANNIFRFSGPNGTRLDQTENGVAARTLGADDKLMYAGRVQLALWDTEPGYYGTGNYFGAKDILTIGIAGRQKTDGAISTTALGDYSSYSVDFLMEKKNVGPGTLSIEGAYYDYDTDDVFLSEQGNAYYVGAGYLFDTPVGWGKFMPFVRHQEFDADNNIKTQRTDVGVNYVMAPYNALISAEYQKTDVTGRSDTDAFLVTLQMQF